MFANLKFMGALFGLCIALASITDSASAVSVEVVKKCNALTAKAFPPREIGNPAAGVQKERGEPNGHITENAWRMGAKCPRARSD